MQYILHDICDILCTSKYKFIKYFSCRFPDGRYSVNPRGPPVGSNDSLGYMEFTVTLKRQETGFGFRIVGGTEEGSQVSYPELAKLSYDFSENVYFPL